jgi:NADH-quinone oxidoreductase E subunit
MFIFNENNLKEAENNLSKYPKEQRFSAVMPLLTLAQKQNGGFLNKEIITYIAKYLNMSEVAVLEVANFYHMYQLKPVGKYHISFCNSIVCFIKNGSSLSKYLKSITGLEDKTVSNDGLFSMQSVGCLGVCVNAPAIKINDYYYEDLTEKSLLALVKDLKSGKELAEIPNIKKSLLTKEME